MRQVINTLFSSDLTVFILWDKVVVQRGLSGLGAHFSKGSRLEFDYNDQSQFSSILEMTIDSFRVRPDDRWFLGLPLKYFSLVNLRLPGVALENLDQAVRYALSRHVPFDLDQAYTSYHKTETGDFLDIASMVIFRDSLRPFIRAGSEAGVIFHGVFPSLVYWAALKGDGVYASLNPGAGEIMVQVDNKILLQSWGQGTDNLQAFFDESSRLLANMPGLPTTLYLWETADRAEQIRDKLGIEPETIVNLNFEDDASEPVYTHPPISRQINLLPRAMLKKKKISTGLAAGALLFFIMTLFSWPVLKIVGQNKYLADLEKRIQAIETQGRDLTIIRDETRELMASIEEMSEMRQSYPPVLNILRELTELIPESGWLTSLNYSNRQITIQGQANSATSVIEAIENSPMFREVRFSTPVTKSGLKEVFTLVAEVLP